MDKKDKDAKTLTVKYGILFVDRLKAIKNIMDSLIYLSFLTSYIQAPNLGFTLTLDISSRSIDNLNCRIF